MCALYIEDRQSLLKSLDQLSNMEVTREELLERARCEVDTTTPTPSPVKDTRTKATKGATRKGHTTKVAAKVAAKTAKIAAAQGWAKELFAYKCHGHTSAVSTSNSEGMVAKLQKELAELKQKVGMEASKCGIIVVHINIVFVCEYDYSMYMYYALLPPCRLTP